MCVFEIIFLLWSKDASISSSGCQCRSLKHAKATDVLLVSSTARVIIRSVMTFESYNCDLWLSITIKVKQIRCCLLVSSLEQTIMITPRISSVWKAPVSYITKSIGNFTISIDIYFLLSKIYMFAMCMLWTQYGVSTHAFSYQAKCLCEQF